ncbi:hypothetical protein [Methylobacterium soli]|nr:hypothetical protein [Methylobacterium soli]
MPGEFRRSYRADMAESLTTGDLFKARAISAEDLHAAMCMAPG